MVANNARDLGKNFNLLPYLCQVLFQAYLGMKHHQIFQKYTCWCEVRLGSDKVFVNVTKVEDGSEVDANHQVRVVTNRR